MKIAPMPPALAPLLPPPGPALAVPFAEHLAGAAEDGRAVSFAELGMFGRRDDAQSPSTPHSTGDIQRQSEQTPAQADSAAARPPEPEPTPATTSRPPVASAPACVGPGEGAAVPHAAAGTSEAAAAILAGASEPPPEAEPELPATAAAASRARPERPPRTEMSLILTEKEGCIGLVAAAPGVDPETRAALGRLVRTILAENGLGLSHFRLNGAPVAPDSLEMTGGFHGPRSG